jgi:beta-N-acetylhexosaminidase
MGKKKLDAGKIIFIVGIICVCLCIVGGIAVLKAKGNLKKTAKETAVETIADQENSIDVNLQGDSLEDGSLGAAEDGSRTGDASQKNANSQEDVYASRISAIMENMSLGDKIGQMFFVRGDMGYDETTYTTYHPGGVILFGSNVQNKTYSQLQADIQSYQDMSTIPMLVGIDEEGGTVTRLSSNPNIVSEKFKSPRQLYSDGGMDAVIEDSHTKSALLKDLGINVNFAPVVDCSTTPGEFMYDRAFGDSVSDTVDFAEKIVTAMNEDNIGAVLKHFPGYGGNGDTHTNIITDDRDYSTFEEQDFLPFEAGIEAGAPCVLVCHNIVNCMDSSWPASLSPKVHEILRDELGFDGVIITDDLTMDGVADFCGEKEAAVQAVLAGNDMMIVSDLTSQYDAVLDAVNSGVISETQVDEAVYRILRWKIILGLVENE